MTERLRAGRAAGVYAFVLALWLLAHVGLVSALLAQPPPLLGALVDHAGALMVALAAGALLTACLAAFVPGRPGNHPRRPRETPREGAFPAVSSLGGGPSSPEGFAAAGPVLLFIGGGLQTVQKIRCLLRVACGGEDRPLVVLQRLEP